MTRRFNPERKKEFLLSELGFEELGNKDIEDCRKTGNIGRYGHVRLGAAIAGILVGLEDQGFELLQKTRTWFAESIRTDEPGVYAGGRAGIRSDAALCDWLLGKDATALFEDAASHCRKPGGSERLETVDLDFTMPLWLHAGKFDEAVALYEAFDPATPKMTVSKARVPRTVAYLIARFQLAPDERFSKADVEKASQRLLLRNVPDWTGRGHWSHLASWLKIVHWDLGDRQLASRDVILKAYDYLPDLSRSKD